MSHYNFRQLDKEHDISLFPGLFSILHENMTKIAPTGCPYEEDRNIWMKYTKKLGFSIVGENTGGTSWYLKAEAKSARDYFHKTAC